MTCVESECAWLAVADVAVCVDGEHFHIVDECEEVGHFYLWPLDDYVVGLAEVVAVVFDLYVESECLCGFDVVVELVGFGECVHISIKPYL